MDWITSTFNDLNAQAVFFLRDLYFHHPTEFLIGCGVIGVFLYTLLVREDKPQQKTQPEDKYPEW